MEVQVEDLVVHFPFEYIYPEQYKYMVHLKRTLDAKGHGVLEMPSGTGKTITILSLCIAYQKKFPNVGKIVYCTRTVPEMMQVMEELRGLWRHRKEVGADKEIYGLGVALSSRKNLCVHPEVSKDYGRGGVVDAKCRALTADFVRARTRLDSNTPSCTFFEEFERSGDLCSTFRGVFTLSELQKAGQKKGWCPYYMARRMINYANVIVFNYQYMIDPKISNVVSQKFTDNCLVVFDEAHNIDNVCIEALSVNLTRDTLNHGFRNINSLQKVINEQRRADADRLQEEYRKLVEGLQATTAGRSEALMANPVLPEDVLLEVVPGNIRKANHFLMLLRKLIEHLKQCLGTGNIITQAPKAFLQAFHTNTLIEPRVLRFTYERLSSLLQTLEVVDVYEYRHIREICDFATLISTYSKGFSIVIEPDVFDKFTGETQPVIQCACLDASIAIRPVFKKFKSVVITSGTISPLDMYPTLLDFQPAVSASFPMTLTRNPPPIRLLVMSKGSDQLDVAMGIDVSARQSTPAQGLLTALGGTVSSSRPTEGVSVTSRFHERHDPAVVANYGKLLERTCATVPDGIICFFVSYQFMEDMIEKWHRTGILEKVRQHKLLFLETTNTMESTLALDNYRKACDCGRGAVFLAIARGKVAEGIDFDGHYGRCVLMLGVPYQYTESQILKERLLYLKDQYQINDSDFLAFDAMRQVAQCIGRVIRNKNDYGIMILADKRFGHPKKRNKLPKWLRSYMSDSDVNLSLDLVIEHAKNFLMQMAQPWPREQQIGHSLWTQEDVNRVAAEMQNDLMELEGGHERGRV